ncbi:MAG: PD-(D/E)XK nuclease family protein, partial [Luteolibacter sp.]
FLGYTAPFLPLLTDHLLEDRATLSSSLIIVPTSQSGRILRESLAEKATALLAPTVTTPGALLHLDNPSIAPTWLEKIAWIETLESLTETDWQNLAGLFPIPPDTSDASSDWAVSLASEITSLRATLQDHLHNLFSASKFLASTPEADRWNDLATLETMIEKRLGSWNYTSRSTALRQDFKLPSGHTKIILAGITEMPPCLTKALEDFTGDITSIIAAPESEAHLFSTLGLPLDTWAETELPATAKTLIVADPIQQANAALEAVSQSSASSSEIALGSADDATGATLSRIFTENGWSAFHPASSQPLPSVIRWLTAWKDWLTKPSSKNLATLLSLSQSQPAITTNRTQTLLALNKLRDRNPTLEPPALQKISNDPELVAAISKALTHRQSFLAKPFPEAITNHLADLQASTDAAQQTISQIHDFLDQAAPIFQKIKRTHTFWLQTLLSEIPTPTAQPPANRIIDIQGWLELLYEPGQHLVICGMNETFVPARSGGEPWLSENIRTALGLTTDADRHARDAYLLHAMTRMREASGSTTLICGKNGNGGETYLPSRLLLQVPRERLVATVENLFWEIEPPEANLVWESNTPWQPPHVDLPETISVTALANYLSCPFRFYLKNIVRMSVPEPDRREMNARDFGSITHLIVENFGIDPEARNLTDPEKITAYLEAQLHLVIREQFGTKPPLAIRIQTGAIAQRLTWFATHQAQIRADGWEIIHTERKISIPSNDFNILGTIDRIDRHRETGQLRVIDYKTGKVSDIERAHRQKTTPKNNGPLHFQNQQAPFQSTTDAKGKPAEYFWKNLQLPLYALAEKNETGTLPIPAYIHLGQTQDNVRLTSWDTFSEEDLQSAKACADWITSSIAARNFWPPAAKVTYDDFETLTQGTSIAEAFARP